MKRSSESQSKTSRRAGVSFTMRVGFWSGFVLLAMAALTAWFSWLLMRSTIEQREELWLRDTLQSGRFALQSGGLDGLRKHFQNIRGSGNELFFLRLDGPGNHALFLSDPLGRPGMARLIHSADPRLSGNWLSLGPEGSEGAWFLATAEVQPGVFLQAGRNSPDAVRLLDSFLRTLLLFLVPAALLGIGGIVLVSRRSTRRIHALISSIRGIVETGRLDQRVDPPGDGTEIDELAHLFNEMLARNEALVATMRESLDNVAHDLRTPMTRLRTVAETAVAANPETTDVEALRNALFDSVEEADRVIAMLDAMMDVAEAEAGAMRLAIQDVPVRELLEQAAEFHEFVAEEKQIRIAIEEEPGAAPEPGPLVKGDPGRLRQVFSNLIDNAVKFSDPGKTVAIRIRPGTPDPKTIEIEIADEGPGIPPGEIERIWDRLYRSERARAKRGLGLGLSLVKAIVEAHGGRVGVRSTPGQGSRFFVQLPAAIQKR